MGYAKWQVTKVKKELEKAKQYAEEKERQEIEDTIEVRLEPIYLELEELRNFVRETKSIEESHLKLIVASYRFRLIQLCKGLLNQGYITTAQMEQLSEFYKLYTGLGGNGQAKEYYEKTIQLQIRNDDDDD